MCICDCGKTKVYRTDKLGKDTFSCGCYNREYNHNSITNPRKKKYEHSDSRENSDYKKLYDCWRHMKARCNNPKDKGYKNYGARGIKVCPEWENDYQMFKKWSLSNGFSLEKHGHELSLDRINVNGDYSPQNCRWADINVQLNNKRNNIRVEFCGEYKTIGEIATEYGMKYSTIYNRYYIYGLRDESLVTISNLNPNMQGKSIEYNHKKMGVG